MQLNKQQALEMIYENHIKFMNNVLILKLRKLKFRQGETTQITKT